MTDLISNYFSIGYQYFSVFLVSFLPRLATSVTVFIVGLIIAYVIYWVINQLLEIIKPLIGQSKRRENRKRLISNTVYWLILLLFLYWAVLSLQLPVINSWLKHVNKFIPQIMVAVLIIITGYIASKVTKTTIIQISNSSTIRLAAELLSIFIITVSLLFALDQININASLINALFVTGFSILFAGCIILLILSSYTIVREMMSAKFVSDNYTIGQRISVKGYEGVIKAMDSTSILLEQDGSQIKLPATMLLKNPVILLDSDI